MKRNAPLTACLTVLLLIATATFTAPVQAQPGIAGGLNFNQLDDINTGSVNANFRSATGYHIGVFYDLALGPIAIRPGIMYRRVGEYHFPELQLPDRDSFSMSLVEVPIDVRWRLLPTPLVKPYLLAGPVLTFPQAEGDLDDGVESTNLTADLGAGIEVTLPGLGFTLMPEFRYGIGATKFIKDEFMIGNTTVNPEDEPRLNSIMLRLNVKF